MKKKFKGRGISECLHKILLIMRVTLLIILVSTNLVFSANSYAQNVKFSFHFSNATVKEVLKAIEDQSEFIVFYQDQQIDLSRKVNIETDNKSVSEILDQLFSGTENVYTVKDRQITIGKSGAQVETLNIQAERVFNQAQPPEKKTIRGKSYRCTRSSAARSKCKH